MLECPEIERGYFAENYEYICGVDEAGRGPLAGPVCAAAVVLPPGLTIPGLDDSKKLNPMKREKLFDLIISASLSYGIAYADVPEIEELNILNATYLAMERAVSLLFPEPELCLIDGNRFGPTERNVRCIVGGDGKCACIAAASVLAKVSRDRLMRNLDTVYPQYGFSKHKGYGTKLHYERLREHGPSPVHRMSFLSKLDAKLDVTLDASRDGGAAHSRGTAELANG